MSRPSGSESTSTGTPPMVTQDWAATFATRPSWSHLTTDFSVSHSTAHPSARSFSGRLLATWCVGEVDARGPYRHRPAGRLDHQVGRRVQGEPVRGQLDVA